MKRFWKILKKVLLVLSSVAIAALFIGVLMAAIAQQQRLVCNAVHVKIDYESGVNFLSTSDITALITQIENSKVVGKRLVAIDLKQLERGLEKNPFIQRAKVYFDHEEKLHTEITQKQPILRVINNDGVGYYLSIYNEKIPLSGTFTAHVPIAMGEVETHEDMYGDSLVRNQIYQFAMMVKKDTLMSALIDNYYVLANGELELYTKLGYHKVLFGRADETSKAKLEKLKIFYAQGLKKIGWDKYSTVNLKYQGQVVCERNGNEIDQLREIVKPIAERDTATNDSLKVTEEIDTK